MELKKIKQKKIKKVKKTFKFYYLINILFYNRN